MFTSPLRIAAVVATLGVFGAAAAADEKKVALKVGDKAPEFCLRDDQDRVWRSADHVGKKWVVIYFYPGDFTPGCTAQANAFKDAMIKLAEQGVEVVGVSGDFVDTHAKFKKAEQLNFALLADGHGTVTRKFGVPFGKGASVKVRPRKPTTEGFEFERPGTAGRWTFVIAPDGTVAYVNTKVIPAKDAAAVSEFIAQAGKD